LAAHNKPFPQTALEPVCKVLAEVIRRRREDTRKRVVLDQLGLELVPTNMPVEMLVIEKVK